MMLATNARAESRCELIFALEKFNANAEVLAISGLQYNSEQIKNAKLNIRNLISQTDGKEALLNISAIIPEHAGWLDQYLVSWIKYVGAYDAGGSRAAHQLLLSSRYMHNQSDLAEAKQMLGCDAGSSVSVLSAIKQLNFNAFIYAVGLTNSGGEKGISSITAFVILVILLALGSLLFWLIFKYDAYRKDCATRYSCDYPVLTKSKYGEIKQQTLNISRSGACLLSEQKYSEGEPIWLLLEEKWRKSKVVWIGGPKIGIEFRFRLSNIPRFASARHELKQKT